MVINREMIVCAVLGKALGRARGAERGQAALYREGWPGDTLFGEPVVDT